MSNQEFGGAEGRARLIALVEDWRKRSAYLSDHAQCEPPAAEQAHVYSRCADDLADLLGRPVPPVAAWQPIETAPKDGTEIIALVSGVPYFVRWTKHERQHAEPWWRDREGYGLTEPTHWQPLPAPPVLPAGAPTPEDPR